MFAPSQQSLALTVALLATLTDCGGDDPIAPIASAETNSAANGAAEIAADTEGSSDAVELDTADAGPVTCKSDKECLALDRVCNKSAGLCVDCNEDTDCPLNHICQANDCVPPRASCSSSKDCAGLSQICDKQKGICVDCLGDNDCGATQRCIDTVCKAMVCQAGEATCDDAATLRVCQANGMGFDFKPCTASHSCIADACKPPDKACTAGSTACSGATLRTCKADGSGYSDIPCPAKSFCAAKSGVAKCEAVTCVPGSLLCVGATVFECGAGGEPADLSDDCGAKGKACKDGACVDKPAQLCTPGTSQCQGEVVQTCDVDGTAWVPGTDCAKVGKICKGGACAEKPAPLCTPGTSQCQAEVMQNCDANGTAWVPGTDCAKAGKACKDGACVEKGGGACTPGSKVCADDVTVAACKSDGSGSTMSACPPKSACIAGACTSTLCTPSEKACNDIQTEKTCAKDGGSWTKVQSCSPTGPCVEAKCSPDKGCTQTPLADGVSCGAGKVCGAGACAEASGCALCGPAQSCASGVCKDCVQSETPAYFGAVETVVPPKPALAGLALLTFSAKHKEWWWLQTGQKGLPGVAHRYGKDWTPLGQTFPLVPYVRAVDSTADGDYVTALQPPNGDPLVARFGGLSDTSIWKIEAKYASLSTIAGLAIRSNVVHTFHKSGGEKLHWHRLDVASGQDLGDNTVNTGWIGPQEMFALGDSLYSADFGGSIMRWLVHPAFVAVGSVGGPNIQGGNNMLGFDGRRACLLFPDSIPGRRYCYDFFPDCGGGGAGALPFDGSVLLTKTEQTALLALVGTSISAWKRCAFVASSGIGLGGVVDTCPNGPTLLLMAGGNSSGADSVAIAGAYTSIGWGPANSSGADGAALLFELTAKVKAVPHAGVATVSTLANKGLQLGKSLDCPPQGYCSLMMGDFACSDGKDAAACSAALWPNGLKSQQLVREVWVPK